MPELGCQAAAADLCCHRRPAAGSRPAGACAACRPGPAAAARLRGFPRPGRKDPGGRRVGWVGKRPPRRRPPVASAWPGASPAPPPARTRSVRLRPAAAAPLLIPQPPARRRWLPLPGGGRTLVGRAVIKKKSRLSSAGLSHPPGELNSIHPCSVRIATTCDG